MSRGLGRGAAVAALVLTFGLAACGVDTTPATEKPADCANKPDVTWDNFAHGLTKARCQGCHASTSLDRRGAPEGVSFDDEDDARSFAPLIRARVLVDKAMPPAGGVADDDLVLLDAWLHCAYDR